MLWTMLQMLPPFTLLFWPPIVRISLSNCSFLFFTISTSGKRKNALLSWG